MNIGEFKPLLLSKSVGRQTLPADTDLYERIFSALKRVAKDTVPLKLVRIVEEGDLITFPVLRKIDTMTYVKNPNKPTADDDILDIDSELEDAVALFVMAGLERTNAKTFMGLYYSEIEFNNDRLIETTLDEASNECADRFMEFP